MWDYTHWETTEHICTVCFTLLGCIIIGWILCKLYSNLYKFECECSRPWSCCIRFSDHHNWLIEPSSSNKVYALLSIVFMFLSNLFRSFQHFGILCVIIPKDTYVEYLFQAASDIFRLFGHTFYFFYMVSILQYQMKGEPLMKEQLTSNKSIKLTQILVLFDILIFIINEFMFWTAEKQFNYLYHGIPYELIYHFLTAAVKIFTEISLLCAYKTGLYNIALWWRSKYSQEYDAFGDTQKIHEILIVITRSTVSIVASFIATCLSGAWFLIYVYGIMTDIKDQTYNVVPPSEYWIGQGLIPFFYVIDDVTYGLSIYFIYEFGHIHYKKLCKTCDSKMYSYFKKRFQMLVKNASFDGGRYTLNNRCVFCCCSSHTISNDLNVPLIERTKS